MKKQCLSILFICLSFFSFGQNCAAFYSTANQTIQCNGVRANLGINGLLHYSPDYNVNAFSPFYTFGKMSNTIFQTNFWLIGKTGNTRKSIFDYYQSTNRNFFSGPLDDVTRNQPVSSCGKWDRFWTVSRAEIEAHKRDFADNGRIDNPIQSILSWPAVGNPNSLQINGFSLPARINGRSYAPFKDVDNDGIYNPSRGDYPAIFDGIVAQPDVISWSVFNDVGGRTSFNMEIQATTYGYECSDNTQAFNNTLFSSFKFINHATTDIDSFKIGLFSDMQAACLSNNFGCDTSLNSFFVYNQDSVLSVSGCGNVPSSFFGNTPVQAITFLNQPLASYRIFNSSVSGSPLAATTEPQTIDEFYNYLSGKWRDGTPLTKGGSGYNPSSQNTTNYAFPSDPFDSSATAWSMARLSLPTVLQRLNLGIADMIKLRAGETKTLDIAYSAHRKLGRNAWQNVKTMREDVAQIRQFYQTPSANLLCSRPSLCEGTDCVWAGDANHDGIANYKDLLPIGVAQTKTGESRNGSIAWSPKTVTNWNSTYSDGNFNMKHIDCDGSGKVDLTDIEVTKSNIQLTRPDFIRPNDVYTEGSNLFMTFDRDPDNLTSSVQNNYNFTGTIKVAPVTDLYGLAFELEYDPYFLRIVTPYLGGTSFTFSDNNLIYRLFDTSKIDANRAQFECSRLGFDFSNNTQNSILEFKLGFNETNFNWRTNITYLKFKNIKGIKRDGTIIPLGGKTQRVRFTDILIDNKEIDAAKIAIFPNPATNETMVNWGKIAVKNIRLSNVMGQIVLEKTVAESAESDVLTLQNFPTGVYFLQIQTVENKIAVRKLIVGR